MTISGGIAGGYKPTDKMWASYDGQWVPIPTVYAATPWVRPTYWPVTTVTAGEQKIQMIVMVTGNYPNNYFTINAAGAYTVSWGDGTANENIATGVTAVHNYSWSASGLTATTPEGYRCALVTVTPQASNQLTSLNLTLSYSGSLNYGPPVLELVVGPSTLTTLKVGDATTVLSACPSLRHINFLSPVTLNGYALFRNCKSLRRVAGTLTLTTSCDNTFGICYALTEVPSAITLDATVTSTRQMFGQCRRLTSFPEMDTSLVTNFFGMFYSCRSMTAAPWYNTSSGTDFGWVFQDCYTLVSVPLYDTSNVTNFEGVFSYCYALVVAPAFNTAKGIDFDNMFENCYSLKVVPTYNTSLGTSFSWMFYSCYCLETVPPLDTANGTGFQGYVGYCQGLTSVPAIDTAKGTAFNEMFRSCQSLLQVPTLNTALATGSTAFANMFRDCNSLAYIPNTINAAGGTAAGAFTSMFATCESLRSNPFTAGGGPKYTFTVADTMLDVTELNALFTALPSVSAQTITITNCPGAAGCTRTIATGKGWTVTG